MFSTTTLILVSIVGFLCGGVLGWRKGVEHGEDTSLCNHCSQPKYGAHTSSAYLLAFFDESRKIVRCGIYSSDSITTQEPYLVLFEIRGPDYHSAARGIEGIVQRDHRWGWVKAFLKLPEPNPKSES